MDEIDLAMLRELARDQVGGWGRLDPRVSASEIARQIDVARSTVSRRLSRWRTTGFLDSFVLAPNSDLFGAIHQAGSVQVKDPQAKPGVLERLAVMDGVAGIMDHVGVWIGVGLVARDRDSLERTAQLVEAIEGVHGFETGPVFEPPACSAELSPLDWRILAALRDDPLGSEQAAAKRVGISARTLRRRYGSLVDGQAVLLLLNLDFEAWTGGALTRFVVHFEGDASRSVLANQVQETLPAAMFINNSLRPPTEHPWPLLDTVAHLSSVAQADRCQRNLLALDPVEEVEVLFPRTLQMVSHWVSDRIDRNLE